MENASKALIIAGAILLAILLISLGIMIYNQAQGVVDGSGMSEAEVQTFNSKLQKYEGKKSGVLVKSMMNEVLANNTEEGAPQVKVTNGGADSAATIYVTARADGSEPTIQNSGEIKNGTDYTVTLVYTGSRISEIQVK